MSATFFAGVAVGWVSLAAGLCVLVAAVVRAADYADHRMPPKQPAGVIDPETALLWDEAGRITTRTWVA